MLHVSVGVISHCLHKITKVWKVCDFVFINNTVSLHPMHNKTIIEFGFSQDIQNWTDLCQCYMSQTLADNIDLSMNNSIRIRPCHIRLGRNQSGTISDWS